MVLHSPNFYLLFKLVFPGDTLSLRPLMKRLFLLVFISALVFADGIGLSGCANMIPPSGGPRDSLPPVLVSASPRDSSLNFTNYRITFVFNEFVEVNNAPMNLIVSPTPKNMPSATSKLRTVFVKLVDTLEPNTTYTLNFGNAIRDINEGNEFKDFTYIFSTGPQLDTISLAGKVILAETGGVDSTLIVVLHTNLDDSAVTKDRPRYYTRVNGDGTFRFQNLPKATFDIYALKDESGQKKYTSPSQLFAFADQAVNTATPSQPIILNAYREKADTRGGSTTTTTGGATGGGRRDRTQAQDRFLRLTSNIEADQLDLLGDLEIRFANPLKTLDTTKVRFTDDQYNDLAGERITLDSTRKVLTFKYPWLGNTLYNVIVSKDFAEDSAGRKIFRDDTLSFRTRKEGDYGALKLRFLNLDLSKNPVLLFVQGEQIKYTHVFTDRNVNVKLFVPGEYDMRILYDQNRNGKWDPGEFYGKHRQPELVVPLSRKLNVKPNWDTEVDITL
jgi:hypothetical protein